MITDIVLDSDGTLMDWQSSFIGKHLPHLSILEFNALPREEREELFRQVYGEDPRLFLGLQPYPYAESLLNIVRRSGKEWTVLTAVGEHPDFNQAAKDKIWNLSTFLGIPESHITVIGSSSEKQHHAKPGRLLIDDFKRNRIEWEQRGGVTIPVSAPVPDLKVVCNTLVNLLRGN